MITISLYDESTDGAWSELEGPSLGRSALEEARATEREPELMALFRVVGVDAQLAEPADAIHHGVAVHAQALGGIADAAAVEQGLEGRVEEAEEVVRGLLLLRELAEHVAARRPVLVEAVSGAEFGCGGEVGDGQDSAWIISGGPDEVG